MYCRTCGAPLGPQDVFCGVCGSKTGIVMSTNIGDHAESVLAAAKHQMMQGAPRSSDILAISSVLDAAQETEEGGTVLLEEPGGIIPGVNDQNQVENAGFRDRSMSLHTGSGSGSGSGSAGGAGGFSFGREANADTIPGLWEEWKVKERIGQGSFGSGYRIEKQDFGRSVFSALKVISVPQNQADIDSLYSEGMSEAEISHYYTDAVQKIVDEFDLMSQLRGHSNIVSYEDHKVIPKPGGIGYDILIRMELLKPFNQYLRENGNEIGRMEVLRLGVDMCKALEACETMHVIHRDIKPENIFVHHLGSFKLGDFGVAREMERTMTVMSKKGTYSYMAPEVYAGKEYDRTVDLYSLGIMLYRYFNGGRLPFVEQGIKVTSDYREQALMKRISGVPLPPPQYARENIWKVIQKACAFRAADRYQSAEEMRRDLEEVAAEVAARAHEEPGGFLAERVSSGTKSAEKEQKSAKRESGRDTKKNSIKNNTDEGRDAAQQNKGQNTAEKNLSGEIRSTEKWGTQDKPIRPVTEAEEENVTVSGVYGSANPSGKNSASTEKTVRLSASSPKIDADENKTVSKAWWDERKKPEEKVNASDEWWNYRKKDSNKKDVSLSYYKANIKELPKEVPFKLVASIMLAVAIAACIVFQMYSVQIMFIAIFVVIFLYMIDRYSSEKKRRAYMEEYYKWAERESKGKNTNLTLDRLNHEMKQEKGAVFYVVCIVLLALAGFGLLLTSFSW